MSFAATKRSKLNMALDLLECARLYVSKIPAAVAGQGGHNQTFTAACSLVKGFDLSINEARPLLTEYNQRCQPAWSGRELEHKLKQADTTADDRERGWLRPEKLDRSEAAAQWLPSRAASAGLPIERESKPEFMPGVLKTFAARWRSFIDTAWLAERSVVLPFGANGPLSAEEFLRTVFRDGEKVVIFTNQNSQGQAIWPLQKIPLAGDEGVWYLAQPVDGHEHPNPRVKANPDGSPKMSRRSAESVTSWRHLVLESDEADPRDWLAALVQLPLRIVAIYTSGKRSIHSLVRIDAPTDGEWNNIIKQIRPMLVGFGADPKAMSAVRLTRLPGCLRGEKLQKLLYLNPKPEPVPICALEKRHDVLGCWLSSVKTAVTLSALEMAADIDAWEDVQRTRGALEWYESAPAAREALKKLTGWMGGVS